MVTTTLATPQFVLKIFRKEEEEEEKKQ